MTFGRRWIDIAHMKHGDIARGKEATRTRRRGVPARVVTARFRPGGQGLSRTRQAL